MQVDTAVAVGHIPSGLFIVTVSDSSGLIDGYLASWVQQVSFSPLLISLAIKPGRPAYDLIKEGHIFSVNIVGEHEKSYLKHFWKGYDPNSNPFKELNTLTTELGGVLLKDAKSSLECRLVSAILPGDHEVIIAEVLASHIHSEEAKSMVHLRKSGLNY
jgi:3-hydroxy-9,10-secoandrosta-1,3,5(10)-triene-9,17-dione monooxygenase reductase component